MQNYHSDRNGFAEVLGIGLIAAAPFLLIILALKLVKFACSSKQSFIFSLCFVGFFVLVANVPKGPITIHLPFEGLIERLELTEEQK